MPAIDTSKNPQDLWNQVSTTMTAPQAAAWLLANADSLTPTQAQLFAQKLNQSQDIYPDMDATSRAVINKKLSTLGTKAEGYKATAASRAKTAVADPTTPVSADLDGDGKVAAWEQQAFNDQTALAAEAHDQKVLAETGIKPAPGKTAGGVSAAKEEITSLGQDTTPPWVLSQLHIPTGEGLNPEIASALIKAYNRANPMSPVNNAAELGARLTNPTGNSVAVVNAVLDGTDPITNYKFNVRDRVGTASQVDVNEKAFKAAQISYGVGALQVGNIVRAAATSGLTNPDGSVAWQVLAALAKANDTNASGGTDKVKDLLNGDPGTRLPPGALGKMFEKTPYTNADDPAFAQVAQEAMNHDADTLNQLSIKFQQGLVLYGYDSTMAFIYASNPSLAARIVGAKILNGDIRIDPKDRAEATFLLSKGGFSTDNMNSMGFNIPSSNTYKILTDPGYLAGLLQAEDDRLKAEAKAKGPVKQHPDEAQVRVAQKGLFQTMYFRDPSPSELAAFSAKLNGAIDAAPEGQDVNPTARLQEFAQGMPDYRLLYGKKQAGMDDATYRQQFQAGAQSMLGGQAPNNEAIKAGMMTGKYQTTLGSIAGDAASQDNSVFMGRLAQAGQAVNEFT